MELEGEGAWSWGPCLWDDPRSVGNFNLMKCSEGSIFNLRWVWSVGHP